MVRPLSMIIVMLVALRVFSRHPANPLHDVFQKMFGFISLAGKIQN